jgi:hypothetical protein
MSADGKTIQAVGAMKTKHIALRYFTLRLAIFLVSLGVLWGVVAATGHIVTANGALYLMMGAVLMSGVASFFLLNRQRDEMSVRLTRKIETSATMEDEE